MMRGLLMRGVAIVLAGMSVLGVGAGRCAAQAPLEPGQMPPRTLFYLIWRGMPSAEARKQNALFGLWDDADFAPMRTGMVEVLMSDTKKEKEKPTVTKEEMASYVSLLDNAFVAGYVPKPPTVANTAGAREEKAARPWNGLFLVYDRSGKEEILSKAMLRMNSGGSEIPKLSQVTIAGVAALKVERKSGTNYYAETGKYAVSAVEERVLEEILNRLKGKGGSISLAQSKAYLEAKPLLGGGILEFFARMPNSREIAGATADSGPQAKLLLNAIKLDSIHVLAGHVIVDGAKTRVQGGILGDTAAGSLFDVWAEGEATPVSLAYVKPETVYYNESQVNLLGIYKTIKRAMTQGGPGANTKQIADTVEKAAEERIGMPLTEALGMTSGEVSAIQTSPSLEASKKVYMLGIRDKEGALKLTRSMFGDRISSEKQDGSTTYLKVSLGSGARSAGTAQWNFFYVAVTPDLMIGSMKSEPLRELLARQAKEGAGGVPKNILEARSQFPAKLNGFSYFDFQKVDWAGLKANWIADANKATKEAKSTDDAAMSRKYADWLGQVKPEVFARHFHVMTGASWKDEKGVQFDEWLQ